MKINVEDPSGLPEWLQSHVTEGELDLAAVPQPEDVIGLKTALQKERANAQAWAKLGEKPEDVQAKIADLEEKAKGTGKGAEDAQAKLDALEQKYKGELTDRDQRIEKMMQANAQASLKSELAKAGFIPEAIDDIAATAMGRLKFNEDGTPSVTHPDGSSWIEANRPNHEATLTDLAKELAEAKPYAVRDQGAGGSGKQPGSNGGTPPKKKFSEMTSGELVRLKRENPQDYERLKAEG